MRQDALLAALRMPLRDAARGASTLAGGAEAALRPIAALMPRPLRGGLRAGLRAARAAARRVGGAPIRAADVARAAEALAAPGRSSETLATVIAHAWEELRPAAGAPLLSETLLAARLSALRIPGRAPEERAAALVAGLRLSPAILRRPGLGAPEQAAERRAVDLVLTAIVVWLLAPRGARMAEERTLLELAAAMARVAAPSGEGPPTAERLRIMADHL